MLSEALSGRLGFADIIVYLISSCVVIFLTLPIHEFAHGFVSSKLGDPTPRWQGRLTLNPLAHIDWRGAACILLFGFGWAKPVQVNQRYYKSPKLDMAIVAFAGPLSNIIVAFISLLLAHVCALFVTSWSSAMMYVYAFFFYVASINVHLAVFNLIPIPPLDGSRLLSAFLPDRQYYKLMQYEQYLFIALIVLMATDVFARPISYFSGLILDGLTKLASLPFAFLN